MNRKALVLLSGGLDSILAARLMKEYGIEAVCVTYFIEFAMCGGGPDAAVKAAEVLGLPLKVFDVTDEYLGMFMSPKHGYGANINPCIDCKIFMLKKAKEYMKEVGASFLVTGEVLGERPMSQRRDALNIIEKNAGVRGILLRPLSGKLLPPTQAEEAGIIDREKLLDIRGRGRKPQMALAEKFGIREYPNPSGGCLLTDPGFTRRVKELRDHEGLSVEALRLLKLGRHFRMDEKTKLVIGRDDDENTELEAWVKEGDVSFRIKDKPGPFSVLIGPSDDEMVALSASIVAQHTKYRNGPKLEIQYWRSPDETAKEIRVSAASQDDIEKRRI